MKKVLIVFIFTLLILVSIWAGGEKATKPEHGATPICDGEAWLNVTICDIEISGLLQKGEYHLVVGELDMKENYKRYVEYKIPGELTVVTPLINLDLYGQSKVGKIVNIQGEKPEKGIEVIVSVPIKLITSKTTVKDDKNIELFFYIDEDDKWVTFNDPRSGVSSLKRSGDSIVFNITKWPINDRMIASGP